MQTATVGSFLEVLRSKLIQHDKVLGDREARRGRVNIYRIGHYLKAVEDVVRDVGPSMGRSDPQALEALKRSIEANLAGENPGVKATVKQIDQYLATGKAPSLTRRNPTLRRVRKGARRMNPMQEVIQTHRPAPGHEIVEWVRVREAKWVEPGKMPTRHPPHKPEPQLVAPGAQLVVEHRPGGPEVVMTYSAFYRHHKYWKFVAPLAESVRARVVGGRLQVAGHPSKADVVALEMLLAYALYDVSESIGRQKIHQGSYEVIGNPYEKRIVGTRAVAQRIVNAENSFIDFAMKTAGLTHGEAVSALSYMRKGGKRAPLRIDAVTGQFTFSHGAFAEPDVIRKAAELGRRRR